MCLATIPIILAGIACGTASFQQHGTEVGSALGEAPSSSARAPAPTAATAVSTGQQHSSQDVLKEASEYGTIALLSTDGGAPSRAVHPNDAGVVNGRLPPELVQQIVRSEYPRLRKCYEEGLRRDPTLAGRVLTRFVIGRDGVVSQVGDADSTLPDPVAVECVFGVFRTMRFPAPEGGIVTVVYPIQFSPGKAEPSASVRPPTPVR